MNTLWYLVNLLIFTQFVVCRDFYLGMFRRNDFLVAQDVIYKAPAPFGFTTAVYGRFFKCPITYFRVVDRLGQGRGPITTIVRGGLRKKFISVRIKSTYRLPISVNIYVGCENKQPSTFKTTRMTSLSTTTISTDAGEDDAESTTDIIDVGNDTSTETATTPGEGNATATDSETSGEAGGANATDAAITPEDGNNTTAQSSNTTETTPEA